MLGWLRGNGDYAVLGGAEASLRFGHREVPISLGLGTGPRLLSEQHFGPLDLGSQFQFASFGEMRVDFTSHVFVGYRFQHYSNAHLGHPNPGLNFHVFTLGYAF